MSIAATFGTLAVVIAMSNPDIPDTTLKHCVTWSGTCKRAVLNAQSNCIIKPDPTAKTVFSRDEVKKMGFLQRGNEGQILDDQIVLWTLADKEPNEEGLFKSTAKRSEAVLCDE